MYKKMIKKIVFILCSTILFCSCANMKEKNYTPPINISFDKTTSADVEKVMNQTANNIETNEESGISVGNYESYNFAGYDGTLSFYYKEEYLLYYQWSITEEDSKKAKKIYGNICDNLTNNYGQGTESNNAVSDLYTTTYQTDTQQVVAQKTAVDSGYEISFMVVGK